MFENPRRGRQARNFTKKCSENSRSQIVFRTDIFRKLTLGAPGVKHICDKRIKDDVSALHGKRLLNLHFASVCCGTFRSKACVLKSNHLNIQVVCIQHSPPADVLWGSFVTHSFVGEKWCVTNEPQRTSAGRLHSTKCSNRWASVIKIIVCYLKEHV